jgi:hypothetical protein
MKNLLKEYIKSIIDKKCDTILFEQISPDDLKDEIKSNAEKLEIYNQKILSSQKLPKLIEFLSMYEDTDILNYAIDTAIKLKIISNTKNRLVYEINDQFVLKLDTESISNLNQVNNINQIEIEIKDNKVSGLYPYIPQVFSVAKNRTWIITEKVVPFSMTKDDPDEFTQKWIKSFKDIKLFDMIINLDELDFRQIFNMIKKMCSNSNRIAEFIQTPPKELISLRDNDLYEKVHWYMGGYSLLSVDLSVKYPEYFALYKSTSQEEKIQRFNNFKFIMINFYTHPFIAKIIQYEAYPDLALRNIGFGYDGRPLILDWGVDKEAYDKF